MSGHSKFSNIKHKKAAQDSARSKIFQKFASEIFTSAKLYGANPEQNFNLKKIIQRANSVNMPKSKIKKALDRAVGINEFANSEELAYECLFAKKVGIIIHCLTNNKNRIITQLKICLRSFGAQILANGSLVNNFEKRIHVFYDASKIKDYETFENDLLILPLKDINDENKNELFISVSPHDFSDLLKVLNKYEHEQIIKTENLDFPLYLVDVEKSEYQKLNDLINALTENPEVIAAFHNAKQIE